MMTKLPRSLSFVVGEILAAAVTTLIVLSTSSCGGGAATGGRTYTLRHPEIPSAIPSKSKLIIGVEPFSAPAPLNDRRILRYESPTELKYYDEDHWVSQPATMIPELAARYLVQMGIARQAALLPWIDNMDHVLQGQILNFEEVETEEQHEARVALELTLLRFPSREVVWTGMFRSRQAIAGDNAAAAVDALSLATQNVLKEGFTELAQSLQLQP